MPDLVQAAEGDGASRSSLSGGSSPLSPGRADKADSVSVGLRAEMYGIAAALANVFLSGNDSRHAFAHEEPA
jgi:hypothetical protein